MRVKAILTNGKIKYSTMMELIIIVLLMNSVSLFKVLGRPFTIPFVYKSINLILIIILFIMCLNYKDALIGCKYMLISSALLLTPIALRGITSNIGIYDYLRYTITYYFVLLSIPVFCLLKKGKLSLEALLKAIVIVTALSFLLRTAISLLEFTTGRKLFEAIYMENAREDWYRNGILRINMPCLGLYIIPMILYLIDSVDKKRKKLYIAILIFIFTYYLIILQSRIQMVYAISELIIYMMLKRRSSFKKMIVCFFLVSIICIILNSTYFESFINTFSLTSGQFGGSTQIRLLEVESALGMLRKNPMLGTGILASDEIVLKYGWTGYLSDIGIFYSTVMLGIFPVIFNIIFFGRALHAGLLARKRAKSSGIKHDVLTLSLGMAFVVTCATSYWMNPYYVINIPFLFAIVEYINFLYQGKRTLHRI